MISSFNIVMPIAGADGYGYSGEELVRAAIENHGADIGVVPHDWQDRRYTDDFIEDVEISREECPSRKILVVYFIPYAMNVFFSEINFGMTMFETTEIPQVWADVLNHRAKGVLVPSEFNKKVFEEKVNVPIETFKLGVNTSTYYMVERKPAKVFTFLMAGLLHYRKGAEYAVRAFQEEFESSEPVRLILKTRRGFFDIGAEEIRDGRITVVDADYSRQDMLDLYHAGDCFLAPSRGEAAGLTPREAMATGLPVIATDWGGLSELTSAPHTYSLRVESEQPAPEVCSSYEYGITQGQSIGNFAEPSVSHLRELMREVYEDREASTKRGFEGAMWVQREWNYNVCSKSWLDAIEKLYNASN